MIVVTGSEGFIGKSLVKELWRRGERVFEIDRHNKDAYKDIVPHNVDMVYHLGALSSTTETNVDDIYNLNIKYSIDLFNWCIQNSIPVSYASSASVYGNGKGPLNYYALSKLTVDLWVKDNLDRFKSIKGYRFFNVYGEGEDHKGGQASPITQFTKQAKETGAIKVFSEDGNGVRDFIWVGDVCRIMIEDGRSSGIYDVGTKDPMSFTSVAKTVAAKYNASIITIPFPSHLKEKYQFYTCASETDGKCISVKDYIDGL